MRWSLEASYAYISLVVHSFLGKTVTEPPGHWSYIPVRKCMVRGHEKDGTILVHIGYVMLQK